MSLKEKEEHREGNAPPANHGHGERAISRVSTQITDGLVERSTPRRARPLAPVGSQCIMRNLERQGCHPPSRL